MDNKLIRRCGKNRNTRLLNSVNRMLTFIRLPQQQTSSPSEAGSAAPRGRAAAAAHGQAIHADTPLWFGKAVDVENPLAPAFEKGSGRSALINMP